MPSGYGIIDLFAGPGGLGEGFASLAEDGISPYRIAVSVESEASAYRTLTLRAFLRSCRALTGALPREYIDFHAGEVSQPNWAEVNPEAWGLANAEALHLELGGDGSERTLNRALRRANEDFEYTILIGGPPCQAYSLVGRARINADHNYVPEDDRRHYLFQEYIRVLRKLRPAAFVMENVKGMLSSTIESRLVFEMLMDDLSTLGGRGMRKYSIRAIRVEGGKVTLKEPASRSDFVVKTEEFGLPQRRHRIIIVGIRSDFEDSASSASIDLHGTRRSVADVIGNLPALRSGLPGSQDSTEEWRNTFVWNAQKLAMLHRRGSNASLRKRFARLARNMERKASPPRNSSQRPVGYGESNDELLGWLERPELKAIAQHETRGHMAPDLERYLFAAVFGEARKASPKSGDFPHQLRPNHRNWNTGIFSDRFRVQLSDMPSTTVTSHISKDGHYFIHPDPAQCRSFTVREAARLQTFPDDYYFLGNRTQQYVQVGNAVPPYLARSIALLVSRALGIGDQS